MGSNKEFVIPFDSLKIGKHNFELSITGAFFEELSYSIIQDGEIKVHFVLDKRSSMMVGEFDLTGVVRKPCDRCTDQMEIEIETSHQVVYKFGEEESDDENLIMVSPSDFDIDISNTLYELLTVALPSRTVHEEDECNQEMLDLLDEYGNLSDDTDSDDEDFIDPRWDILKKLN